MDSPEGNPISVTSTSTLTLSSSPTVQESPFLNYLRNLSPIRSAKAARYAQGFSQTNFTIPPPVFTSPREDFQRKKSFREEIDAAGSDIQGQGDTDLNPEPIHFFQKEDNSRSPSGCIDEYLADPVDMEDTTKSSNLCAQSSSDIPAMVKNRFSRISTHEDAINRDDDPVDSHMLQSSFFGTQHHDKFASQAADGQDNKVGSTHQSLPPSLQSVMTHKDFGESLNSALTESAKDADQHQRGIRRHLQFGVTVSYKDTGNGTHDTADLSLPEGHTVFESLVSNHIEPSGISNSWQAGSHAQAVTLLSSFCPSQPLISAENCGNHNISAWIPSDLALPSSGFIKSNSTGSDSTASQKLVGKVHQQGEKQIAVRNRSSASVGGEIYAQVEDDQQESQADATQLVPYDGRILTSQSTNMVEELLQASPKRNRRMAKCSNENEGCKRCKCKRSKCLKLYCECFAAGVYCLDSCACRNCFNRPEYEDTVLDRRQQIEGRNPHAFAPKVVNHATDSPSNIVEEGNGTTPSSARHKRGCNCKKSKCLKKYCECYQARVGCSNGCRCEGCNNSFGKKTESIYRRADKWKNPSHEQLDTLETRDGFVIAGRAHQLSTWEELADMSHLTPLSHCHAGKVATSLNIGDNSRFSQSQAYQESTLHSSAGYLHSHHSPISPTPKLYGSKVLPEINSDTILYQMLEHDTPETFENTLTPIRAVKISSPNQKRVSSQIQSQMVISSTLHGLRSGRKLILPAVPSFPPLSPYVKLKDGSQQSNGDSKDSVPAVSDAHI